MHPHPGSAQASPSPEPTAPTQREEPEGVVFVPEYFHQADMTHLTIMIGKSERKGSQAMARKGIGTNKVPHGLTGILFSF